MRPLIGVTCYVDRAKWGPWDMPAALVPLSYVRAVQDAGGKSVLIPPTDEGIEETLDALDGFLLSGGPDIDPALYGAEPSPHTTGISAERDRSEFKLLQGALDRDLPVLAVCRGMQIMNVLRGGDLMQHLSEEVGTDISHKEAPGKLAPHEVTMAKGSRLESILGPRAVVKSHHHQGPRHLGAELTAVAWAKDATIEGIEDDDHVFAIGVLWHPEEDEDRKLFRALVQEGAKRGQRKARVLRATPKP
jgi:putative glutamine amidotransferase